MRGFGRLRGSRRARGSGGRSAGPGTPGGPGNCRDPAVRADPADPRECRGGRGLCGHPPPFSLTRPLHRRRGRAAPGGRPVARSASRAACSRTAAAAASTTWRRARASLPPRRSASCASVVVNRSSTSRTGTGASRPARSAANSLAPAAAGALAAGQRRGQPDDDLYRAFARGQPGQFGPGLRGLRAGTRRQHRQRRSQNAARVAASDSDADRTHVHREPHPLPERKLTHRDGPGTGPGWTRPGTEDPGRSQEHANTLPTGPGSVPRCPAKPDEPRQMPHL